MLISPVTKFVTPFQYNSSPNSETGFNPVFAFSMPFFERRVEILHKIPILFCHPLLYKIEGKGGAAHVDPTLTPVWDRDFSLGGGALCNRYMVLCGGSGGEETDPPDLSQIESPYLLEDNRALFPCDDGSYVAISTEGTKRMYVVKLWRTSSGWEVRLSASLRPGFRKAFCVDQNLYFFMDITDVLEEGSGVDAPAIQIIRYHMEDEQTQARIIRNAVCDYDRTCQVESGGRILLVHAPLLEEISDATPVRVYQLIAQITFYRRGRNCRSSRRAGRARNHPPGANPLNRKPVRRSSICLTGRSPFRSWRIPTRNTSASCASPGRTGASKLPAVWQPGISWRC